ncbi:MAG TPA: Gfo/Idh/MocA family oxidoreductase [Candidatus Hydrogenedentes bacterium]|nr:Gfo/Idh/MocA family oxidoreductase [Candidatus Hydrogenedentota bacterium]
MSQLGVGIVGTGWVSGEHVRAFEVNPHTKVVALCGRTEEGTKAKAAECGISCGIYTNFEKMLANPDVKIISIATPPHVHRDQAITAAQAGKHIMLEKAMATTVEDSRAIRDAVAKAGVKSVVSFVLRWNPLFEIIKSQLADDLIGDIMMGEVDYFHGIGPWYKQFGWNIKKEVGVSSLMSAGCHAMDALRWFMGGDVSEVFQYATYGKGADFAGYEYPPTTCTMVKFTDGRIGKVASCIECIQPYVFNINLVGAHGTIKNNQIYSKKKLKGQTTWATVPTIMPDSGDVTHHPFVHEAAHLVDCILGDTESHCNIADAYKSHELCFAADLSGREGKPVKLPL